MLFSTVWWLTLPVVIFGATVSAMSGFGFAIVTTPLMLLLYPPRVAVPMILLLSSFGLIVQAWRSRQHADYRLVGGLFLASIPGMPLGIALLYAISGAVLKLLVGISTLVGVLFALRRPVDQSADTRSPSVPMVAAAGLTSGILSTAISQAGVPIALLMAWTGREKQTVRATTFTYFVVANLAAALLHLQKGTITAADAGSALVLAPTYFIGMVLGDWLFRRLSQVAFRRVMLAVLSLSATIGLMTGFSALIN